MSYGDPKWQQWVLPEEEAIKHIKFAYVLPLILSPLQRSLMLLSSYESGITTFDTANVRL